MNNKYKIKGEVTELYVNDLDGSVCTVLIDTDMLTKAKMTTWYMTQDKRIYGAKKKCIGGRAFLERHIMGVRGRNISVVVLGEKYDFRKCNLRVEEKPIKKKKRKVYEV